MRCPLPKTRNLLPATRYPRRSEFAAASQTDEPCRPTSASALQRVDASDLSAEALNEHGQRQATLKQH